MLFAPVLLLNGSVAVFHPYYIRVSRKSHCDCWCGASRPLRSCCYNSVARFRHIQHAHRPSLISHGDFYFATLGFWASVKPSNLKCFRNPPPFRLIGHYMLAWDVYNQFHDFDWTRKLSVTVLSRPGHVLPPQSFSERPDVQQVGEQRLNSRI